MKKIFVVLATVGVIMALYLVSPYREAQTPKIVSLTIPKTRTIQDTVTLHGYVADPARKRLYADGISVVKKIYVSPGDMVQQGQLLMRLEKIDEHPNEQAAAAAALGELRNTLENGDLSEAETMLEGMISVYASEDTSTQTQIYDIFSPVTGMVMRLAAREGEQVHSFLPCVEVSDLSALIIEAEAGEEVIGKLVEEMECAIAVPAFELSYLQGKISQILPYAQQTGGFTGDSTAKTTVCVTVNDPAESLRPGYRATVQVIVARREKALVVPYETITQDEDGREYVLKLEDDRAVKQLVVTGAELTDGLEVCDGISDEDLLIVYPDTVIEGERVNLVS